MWTLGYMKAAPSSGNMFSRKAGLLSHHDAIETGAGAAHGSQPLRGSKPRL